MNELKIFEFEHAQVRTVLINGAPWFIAMDVASVLGYADAYSMTRRLRAEDISKIATTDFVVTNNMAREYQIINEAGIYTAIMGSKKEEAVKFQIWVTSVVLPSIRKTGQYSTIEDQLPKTRGELIIEYGRVVVELEKKDALLLEQQPKVDSYHSLMDARGHVDMADVAKIISETVHFHIGRNILFRILKHAKVLNERNIPHQEFMNRGLFDVVASNPNDIGIKKTTLVTAKGIDFIRNLVITMPEDELIKAAGSKEVAKAVAKYYATDLTRNRNAIIPSKGEEPIVEEIPLDIEGGE